MMVWGEIQLRTKKLCKLHSGRNILYLHWARYCRLGRQHLCIHFIRLVLLEIGGERQRKRFFVVCWFVIGWFRNLLSASYPWPPGSSSDLSRSRRSPPVATPSSHIFFLLTPHSIWPICIITQTYLIVDKLQRYFYFPSLLMTLVDQLYPALNLLLVIYIF